MGPDKDQQHSKTAGVEKLQMDMTWHYPLLWAGSGGVLWVQRFNCQILGSRQKTWTSWRTNWPARQETLRLVWSCRWHTWNDGSWRVPMGLNNHEATEWQQKFIKLFHFWRNIYQVQRLEAQKWQQKTWYSPTERARNLVSCDKLEGCRPICTFCTV